MKTLAAIIALSVTATGAVHAEGHEVPVQLPVVELTGCAAIGAAFGASTGANPIVGGIAFIMCAIVAGNHPELIQD